VWCGAHSGIEVVGGRCPACEEEKRDVSWHSPACACLDCTAAKVAGAAEGAKRAAELELAAGPRTCIGIPGDPPDVACDTVLGSDQIGNRCSVCERWMHVHGRCDGCMSPRVPGWTVTGEICSDCRAQRLAEIDERESARANARAREQIADAASGRAGSVIFPAAGDIAGIGMRPAGAGKVELSIYDQDGVAEMRPLVQAVLERDVANFLWGELLRCGGGL